MTTLPVTKQLQLFSPLSGEDFKMAETKQHAFRSPELHWLNNYLGSSDTLKRNTFLQNLLGVPVNQDSENGNLVVHGGSSKPSSHLSHGGSPPGEGTNKQNGLLVGVMNTTFKIAVATALAPIERVNIMMQCQNEMIKAGRLSYPYKGMIDCLRRTIKREGVISLWRGNSVNVITLCAKEAIGSAIYHLPGRDTKMKDLSVWFESLTIMSLALCDYPLKYARVRLATDVKAEGKSKFSVALPRNNINKRQFTGIIDTFKKTLQLDGVHGVYRGFSVSCIGLWVYFMADSVLKIPREEKHNQENPGKLELMITGCLDYIIPPLIFYPFLTVSRRMMMTSGEARKYRSVMHAFCRIVISGGQASLFKGLTPYLIHTSAKGFILFGYFSTVF